MPKTASVPKKTPKVKAEKVKKEIVKEEDQNLGNEKGIKLASFKTQAKNLGIRCQRTTATVVLRDFINSKIQKIARIGAMNASARGAATITRKDCQEICKV